MNSYLPSEKEVEKDVRENNLNIEEGWSAQELERIFNLDDDQATIGHAKEKKEKLEGPNYFLIGGPYPNYNILH